MFDLRITGGTVVHADREIRADIAIANGRVAALIPPGDEASSNHAIDAAGCWLMPGLVDAHAHLREPGLTHKEDFDSGTRAAALGGVTTVLDMPTDEPWTADVEDLAAKMALAAGRLHVDVGFQVAVTREGVDLGRLAELAPVSYELFTADVPARFRFETLDAVTEALRSLREVGAVIGVSPGDQSLLDGAAARHPAGDIAAFLESRPVLAEAGGLARAVLAAAATGARIHVRQINSALGLDTWRRLRGLADATVETTPQNLFFTAEDYRIQGAWLKASPPFRSRADVAALRQSLRDGAIDIVATDHAPHAPAEKRAAYPVFADIPGGMPGLQTLLPLMLKLIEEDVIAPTDLVRLCATAPASRFRLGDRKGTIAPGRDADILVIDPRRPSQITAEAQASRAATTPFAGWTVPGCLTRVLLRGREIVRDGTLVTAAQGQVVQASRGGK